MNLFGIVMNKGEAHMRVIDGEISCAQTGQELLAAKVINDQGSARCGTHRRSQMTLYDHLNSFLSAAASPTTSALGH
jgi:hypothetical protein